MEANEAINPSYSLPPIDNSKLPIKKGIDPQLVLDLSNKGYTQPQIAKILKCSKFNVFYHLHRLKPQREITKFFVDNRSEILQDVQRRLLLSIDDEEIKKTPIGSRIMGAGILFDKERLESDQATANINHHISIAPELRSGLSTVSSKMDQVICVPGGGIKAINRDKDVSEHE